MAYQRSEAQIMEKIRNAMKLADDAPEGSAEREAALYEANRLMTKHAIDMAMLDATRTVGEKRVPTQMRFRFMTIGDSAWEWIHEFRTLMWYISKVNRCRTVMHPGTLHHDVTVVGMQEDVEWVQMLWMQIFLEFISRVNPKWDTSLAVGENVARLKEAGWKWEDIWREGKRADPTMDDLNKYDPKGANYLMRAYKNFLKSHPDRPQVGTQRFAAYRYSFVKAFITTINMRLERMARESKEQQDQTSGSELALVDVSDRVDEEFYRLFPSQRPLTDEEMRKQRQEEERQEREAYDKDQAFLASLSDEKRKRVMEEREAKARRDAAADDRYWRRLQERQERLHHDAGSQAGRAAAQTVNLSRSTQVPEHLKKAVEG